MEILCPTPPPFDLFGESVDPQTRATDSDRKINDCILSRTQEEDVTCLWYSWHLHFRSVPPSEDSAVREQMI